MSIQKFPEKGGDARLQVMKVRPSLEKSQWNLGVPDSFLLEASSTYESSAISWLLQERQRLVFWKQIVGSNQSNGVEKALKIPKETAPTLRCSWCFHMFFHMFLRGFSKKKSFPCLSPPQKHLTTTKPCFNSCAPRSIWTEALPPRYIAPRRRFSAAPRCTRRPVPGRSGRMEWSVGGRSGRSEGRLFPPRCHASTAAAGNIHHLENAYISVAGYIPKVSSYQWGVIFWTQKKDG